MKVRPMPAGCLHNLRVHCSGFYCLLLLWVGVAASDELPGKSAIASAHPLATAAGQAVLQRGGNAFDAAIAVAAALAVVEPNSSGLGGGGFFLLHRASDDTDVFVDAREVAPRAAGRDLFLDATGQAIAGASRNTALAAAIPGEVAGMVHIAERYGRLPLAASLAPAIHLARSGFAVYPRLQATLALVREQLLQSPDARRIFLRNGVVPPLGTVIRQPQLAKTLEQIANDAGISFYRGSISRTLVAGVAHLGGLWTAADLADYRVIERAPLKGHYRGLTITSAPLPSSGGIALINALNLLSGYALESYDTATRKHLVIEALRRVHRDRSEYLGDPAFVSAPVPVLIDPMYAAGQRTSLRLDRATLSATLPGFSAESRERFQTTHLSIVDAAGNRVAATLTVNFGFGSGLMIDGTGIFLNNEMDDFAIKPGHPNGFGLVGAEANAIAPGKRPLSSMAPTFVEADTGLMVLGSPGGSYIPTMVLLGTLEWLGGATASDIVALRRFHHQYLPDVVSYEAGALSDAERAGLEQRGHRLSEVAPFGNMQVVIWNRRTGQLEAASDPRGAGAAGVY